MDGRSTRGELAEPAARAWHSLDPSEVLVDLQVDIAGIPSGALVTLLKTIPRQRRSG